MHTKTETLRRLRVAAAEARKVCGLPKNSLAEVGHRWVPQATLAAPETAQEGRVVSYAPDDDLQDFDDLDGAARDGNVQREGAVVHLYLSVRDPFYGEWLLEDVCVAWLGHGDQEPILLDANGRSRLPDESEVIGHLEHQVEVVRSVAVATRYRAECACGWTSDWFTDEIAADGAAGNHEEASLQDAG